ncbi:MAG TPA: hypothetical protein VNQ79_08570 [Blastocatellia bacterium]|nr:hypothetical protein [Blastocatellia bacterium]
MKTTRFFTHSLSLILALSGGLLPVRADDEAGNSSGLYVSASAAPIGTFESTDRVIINGRVTERRGELWDGELLHAPAGTTAKANLSGIGQLILSDGAMVRLSSVLKAEPHERRRLLFASVLSGGISVRLESDASAFLLAGGAAFTASAGAAFSLTMSGGRPVITSENGAEVRGLGRWSVRMPGGAAGRRFIAWPAITLPAEAAERAIKVTAPKADSPDDRRAAFLRSLGLAAPGAVARLYSSPLAGMIGTVEAAAAVRINGRLARGREMLWDGETIQTPDAMPARVTLDGIGSLTIAASSVVRLSAALMRTNDAVPRRVLVATVISGDGVVRVQPEAVAFVQAFGNAFAADGGAHFRLGARDGRAVVDVTSGTVQSIGRYVIELTAPVSDVLRDLALVREQRASRQYRVIPVGFGSQTVVAVRGSRELRFRITDANGKAAAGVPVSFALRPLDRNSNQATGSFGTVLLSTSVYSALTSSDGLVTVPFTAGTTAGSVIITAAVSNQPQQRAALITTASDQNRFWNAKTAVPVFLTAAAIIAAGATVAATQEDRFPIRGSGPTLIVP